MGRDGEAESRITRSWAGEQLLREEEDRDRDGRADRVVTHAYEDGLQVASTVDHDGDGIPDLNITRRHDQEGRVTTEEWREISTGRVLRRVSWTRTDTAATEDVDLYDDGIPDQRLTHTYQDGLLVQTDVDDGANGSVELRVTMTYVDGRVSRREWRGMPSGTVQAVAAYGYDPAGNLVQVHHDRNGDGTWDSLVLHDYGCWEEPSTSSSSGSSSSGGTSSSSGGSTSSGGVDCSVGEDVDTTVEAPVATPAACEVFSLEAALSSDDADFVVVSLLTGQVLVASTDLGDPASCPGVDTVLDLHALPVGTLPNEPGCGGTSLACDDDGGPDACSRLTYVASSDGDYLVRIRALAGAVVPSYRVVLRVMTPECGNGVVEGAEACDDGNALPGDGCSPTCGAEGASCSAPVVLSVGPDEVVVGPFSTAGQGNDFSAGCASTATSPDTVFEVTALQDGALHVTLDSEPFMDGVLAVTGTGCAAAQTACVNRRGADEVETLALAIQAGQTRWVHVDSVGGPGNVTLRLRIAPPGCGNGVVEANEACDDGNTTSADGCSATCQDECRVPELTDTAWDSPERIPDFCTEWHKVNAALSAGTDQDFYVVQLAAGESVEIETYVETEGTCSGADTVVDVARAPLTAEPTVDDCPTVDRGIRCDDDSGASTCSLLEFTATQAGDHVIRVIEYNFDSAISRYDLRVTRLP
ncbi:MAG: DUF4215 domain-containing protein [Myxococcota bacterium]